MKNRKFVCLFAFLFALTLTVPVLADNQPPFPASGTSLTLEPVEAAAGTEFTVTAVLKDDEGTPLEGKDLDFSFGKDTNDDGVLDEVIDEGGTKTTDPDGYAEYTFTAPETEGEDYDYRAYFDGTENYDFSAKTAQVTVSTGPEVGSEGREPAGQPAGGKGRLPFWCLPGEDTHKYTLIHIYTHSGPFSGAVK